MRNEGARPERREEFEMTVESSHQRKGDRERRSFSDAAGNLHLPLMRLHDPAHDGEAEAGAAGVGAAGAVGAEETLEHEGEVLLRDADAGIADLDPGFAGCRRKANVDSPAGIGIADRVLEKVVD